MKIILSLVVAAALAAPTAALAAPKPHQQHGKAQPKVMYVLKGTVTAYAAGSSITIDVSASNRHGRVLKNTDVTVNIGPNTKLRLMHGLTTVSVNDNVTVKARAAKVSFKDPTAAADVTSALAASTAFQIIDKGAPPTSP